MFSHTPATAPWSGWMVGADFPEDQCPVRGEIRIRSKQHQHYTRKTCYYSMVVKLFYWLSIKKRAWHVAIPEIIVLLSLVRHVSAPRCLAGHSPLVICVRDIRGRGSLVTGPWCLWVTSHLDIGSQAVQAATLGPQVNVNKQGCSFRLWRPTLLYCTGSGFSFCPNSKTSRQQNIYGYKAMMQKWFPRKIVKL